MNKTHYGLAVLVGLGVLGGGCATKGDRAGVARSDKAMVAYVESTAPLPADFPSVGWTSGSSVAESN